jgi:hypothetical protein
LWREGDKERRDMAGGKDDKGEAPRDTYIPKPPSKEEVDQVSREQGMISDEWTGEPPAGGEAEGGKPEG